MQLALAPKKNIHTPTLSRLSYKLREVETASPKPKRLPSTTPTRVGNTVGSKTTIGHEMWDCAFDSPYGVKKCRQYSL